MKMTSSMSLGCQKRHVVLVLQFLSITLLYVPNGVGWYFGNLVVYLNSYWFAELQITNFQAQWVISIYIIGTCTSVIIAGNIIKIIPPQIISFMGVLLFDLGIVVGYFAVQYSQSAFLVTFSGLTGVGYGLIQTEVMTRIPKLVSRRVGVALAMMNNGMNVGTIVINWLITWYINPDNLRADLRVSKNFKVFTNKSVVDRVPSIFLVLGILTFACHISGFILSLTLQGRSGAMDKSGITRSAKERMETNSSTNELGKEYQEDHRYGSNTHVNDGQMSNETLSIVTELTPNDSSIKRKKTDTNDNAKEDLNPFQIMKTANFYLLWFCFLANDTAYVFLLNFYKIFGELWIEDDHFLTQLALAFLITVIVMRLVWALIMDKFGVKNTHIILTTALSLASAFYYFAPQINKWLFGLFTCLLSALNSAVYLIYPISALQLYGQTYFAANYGCLVTSVIVLNAIAPTVSEVLLHHFGWSAIFLGTSAINVLALFITVLGFRNDKSKPIG